jgi:hypothetical protein
MTARPGKRGWLFQPLTMIRQTGTLRAPGGTTTYTFAAIVHRDLPPVKITLTITPQHLLHATACFDAMLREAMKEAEEHSEPTLWKEGATW